MRGLTGRIMLAVLPALALALTGCDAIQQAQRERIEQEFEQSLRKNPSLAEFYAVMEADFPQEFGQFKSELLQMAETGASEAQLTRYGFNFMRRFMADNIRHVETAPDAELFALRDNSLRTVELLADFDTGMCARYVVEGLDETDKPQGRIEAQFGRNAATMIRAVVAGRDSPVERGDPTQADVNAFGDALSARGMSDGEIDDFLADGAGLTAASDADQCRIGKALYQALLDIPDDASARIAAIMLAPEF